MADSPNAPRTRLISPEWLHSVRSLKRCVLCGAEEGVQAVHRNDGGYNTSDHLTAALCLACDVQINHNTSITRPEQRLRMNQAIVLTLDALVRNRKLKGSTRKSKDEG